VRYPVTAITKTFAYFQKASFYFCIAAEVLLILMDMHHFDSSRRLTRLERIMMEGDLGLCGRLFQHDVEENVGGWPWPSVGGLAAGDSIYSGPTFLRMRTPPLFLCAMQNEWMSFPAILSWKPRLQSKHNRLFKLNLAEIGGCILS